MGLYWCKDVSVTTLGLFLLVLGKKETAQALRHAPIRKFIAYLNKFLRTCVYKKTDPEITEFWKYLDMITLSGEVTPQLRYRLTSFWPAGFDQPALFWDVPEPLEDDNDCDEDEPLDLNDSNKVVALSAMSLGEQHAHLMAMVDQKTREYQRENPDTSRGVIRMAILRHLVMTLPQPAGYL